MRFTVLLLMGVLVSTPQGDGAEQFTQQFETEPVNKRLLKLIGPLKAIKPSKAGLIVTLPAEEGSQAGVETRFGISGDFEITAGYEIPDLTPPEKGYGVGVILRLGRVDSEDYAAFGRRIQRSGTPVFNANNSKLAGKQRKHDQTFHEAKEPRGELRVVRKGTVLNFLVKEGDAEAFREIRQVEFSDIPLNSVKFVGDTGGSKQEMTVRLTSLSIRADGLPYGPTTAAGQFVWTIWQVLGSASVLLLLGAGVWFWRKRAEE
ncbi:MAG: DUF1583 domain-containing protein [Planctomycetaceae bacterium]